MKGFMKDVADELQDIKVALDFLEACTTTSETSGEVCEGFIEAARTMLPKQTKGLERIIGELREAVQEKAA